MKDYQKDYRCDRCVWGAPSGIRESNLRICRKDTPRLHPEALNNIGYWPTVHATDWCGQFTPERESAPPAKPGIDNP